jgi:hypothetical protein
MNFADMELTAFLQMCKEEGIALDMDACIDQLRSAQALIVSEGAELIVDGLIAECSPEAVCKRMLKPREK